jgi:hypothetical protein
LLGAGSSTATFRSANLRATSAESLSPSKRRAARASSATAPMSASLASAAIFSVSSVMKFDCTQLARSDLIDRS